jgi:hypothetical protein
LQGGQRPGGGPIRLAVRRPAHLGQDPFLLSCSIGRSRAAAVSWLQRRQSLAIEAPDQLGYRIAAPPPRRTRGIREALARGHRQQRFGVRYLRGWFAHGAADARQPRLFDLGEWTQRLLLLTWHRRTPDRLDVNTVRPSSLYHQIKGKHHAK